MSPAEIIKQQIGNKALFMLGTKAVMSDNDGETLILKIGRNDKKVNIIKVTATAQDLYDVEFGSQRGLGYKVKASDYGIYADMLRSSIERNTGMYTSF